MSRRSSFAFLAVRLVGGWFLAGFERRGRALAAALCVFGAMLGASPAAAAEAPMCDTDATSIAAEAEIPDADGGSLEELPCDVQVYLAWVGLPLAERSVRGPGALPNGEQQAAKPPYKFLGLAAAAPPLAPELRVPAPGTAPNALRQSAGFGLGVFRPPAR